MNDALLLARRVRIAQLYLQGHTRDSIAEQLQCPQGSVSSELVAIKQEWAELVSSRLDDLRAEEVAKLGAVEAASWAMFLKTGSPAHMRSVLKCIELRARLHGLLKDTLTVKTQQPTIPWEEVTRADAPDLIEARIALLEQPPTPELIPSLRKELNCAT